MAGNLENFQFPEYYDDDYAYDQSDFDDSYSDSDDDDQGKIECMPLPARNFVGLDQLGAQAVAKQKELRKKFDRYERLRPRLRISARTYRLLDMRPRDETEVLYLRQLASTKRRQIAVQTRDDDCDRATETDFIARTSREVQVPDMFTFGENDDPPVMDLILPCPAMSRPPSRADSPSFQLDIPLDINPTDMDAPRSMPVSMSMDFELPQLRAQAPPRANTPRPGKRKPLAISQMDDFRNFEPPPAPRMRLQPDSPPEPTRYRDHPPPRPEIPQQISTQPTHAQAHAQAHAHAPSLVPPRGPSATTHPARTQQSLPVMKGRKVMGPAHQSVQGHAHAQGMAMPRARLMESQEEWEARAQPFLERQKLQGKTRYLFDGVKPPGNPNYVRRNRLRRKPQVREMLLPDTPPDSPQPRSYDPRPFPVITHKRTQLKPPLPHNAHTHTHKHKPPHRKQPARKRRPQAGAVENLPKHIREKIERDKKRAELEAKKLPFLRRGLQPPRALGGPSPSVSANASSPLVVPPSATTGERQDPFYANQQLRALNAPVKEYSSMDYRYQQNAARLPVKERDPDDAESIFLKDWSAGVCEEYHKKHAKKHKSKKLHPVRLASFLERSCLAIEELLESNTRRARLAALDQMSIPGGHLAAHIRTGGKVPLAARQFALKCSLTEMRPVVHLAFAPTDPRLVAAVYGALPHSTRLAPGSLPRHGFIMLWNLNERKPIRILRAPQTITCCCFSPHVPHYVVAGTQEGSCCLWDLRAPSSDAVRVESNKLTLPAQAPSYTTNWFSQASKANHPAPVIRMLALPPHKALHRKQTSASTVFQVATLDECGNIIVWTATELAANSPISQSDFGLAPGARVRLISTTFIGLFASADTVLSRHWAVDQLAAQPLMASAFAIIPGDTSQFLVATCDGKIHRVSRLGKPSTPDVYEPPHDVAGVRSLHFSPVFQDTLLVCYADGTMSLYNLAYPRPLTTWYPFSAKVPAIRGGYWSPWRASQFFVMHAPARFNCWDLAVNREKPLPLEGMKKIGEMTAFAAPDPTDLKAHRNWPCLVFGTRKGAILLANLSAHLSFEDSGAQSATDDYLQSLVSG